MKQQMAQSVETENEDQQIVIGAAKGLTMILFAGMMNWYIKAGSLLASLLSTVPLWTPFDPLPILSLSREERDRRRREASEERQREDRSLHRIGCLLDDPPASDPVGAEGVSR